MPRRPFLGLTLAVIALAVAGCARFQPAPKGPADEPIPEPIPGPIPEKTEQIEQPPVLSVDDVYQSISLAVQAGDAESAIAAYQDAQLESPDDPGTTVLLANLYLIGGAIDDASALLDEVLAEQPENTDALFLSSLIAAARSDRDLQRSTLETLLQVDPGNVEALASLGELQLQDRKLDEAEASFSAALDGDDENLVARMGLANVYLRKEEYEDAEKELDSAIELHPDFPFSYTDRARARALQRRFPEAIDDLSTALEIEPDYLWNYVDRGRVYMEQRLFRNAEQDFSTAIELDDSQFLSYVLRARARDELGDEAGALQDYESGLKLRPDYNPAYLPVGTLYYLAGRFAEAVIFIEAAFEADPQRLEYILFAALAHKASGDDAGAEEWLNANINSIPRDSIIYTVARYYLMPSNDGYVLAQIRAESNHTLAGQMYFYVGAQLELIGREATAQAVLLEAEELVPQGVLESRLATRHLDAYRSGSH